MFKFISIIVRLFLFFSGMNWVKSKLKPYMNEAGMVVAPTDEKGYKKFMSLCILMVIFMVLFVKWSVRLVWLLLSWIFRRGGK